MINNISEFAEQIDKLNNISDAYYLFEDQCSPELQKFIYNLADKNSAEPFRSAMHNMGYTNY